MPAAERPPHDRRPSGRIRRARALAVLAVPLVLLLLGWLLPATASAHGRSVSYSSWVLTDDGARVAARVSLLELSRLGIPLPLAPFGRRTEDAGSPSSPAGDAVGRYLAANLRLLSGDAPCEVTSPPRLRPADEGWVLYRWQVTCSTSGARRVESRILLDVAPSHLHFARVTLPGASGGDEGGRRIVERVLSDAAPSWPVEIPDREADARPQPIEGSSLGTYLSLGIEHILSGWDHLAFVLALVLLAGRLGEVARLVTGFTVAHSITLALAVLGLVHPRAAPVEAVIGFSVALIAAENAWLLAGRHGSVPAFSVAGLAGVAGLAWAGMGQLNVLTAAGLALFSASHFGLLARGRSPERHRIALAFAFGLVHGFGFAGVLAEMTLPTDRLAMALFGFNVGVELGQLAVVAILWPALVWLRRPASGRWYRFTAEALSAGVCGLGVYWFVTRSFGAG